MDQAAEGLIVIGWKAALAAVAASSVLTTGLVWLLARFTTAFDSYSGERAKLLAQSHDLEKLIEQTKALTATAETIKARVSDEVWDRRMRWTGRKDFYFRVLKAVGRLIQIEQEILSAEHFHSLGERTPDQIQKIFGPIVKRLERMAAGWNRLVDIAPLIVTDEFYQVMTQTVYELLDTQLPPGEEVAANIKHLKISRSKMQQLAKAHLGYPDTDHA